VSGSGKEFLIAKERINSVGNWLVRRNFTVRRVISAGDPSTLNALDLEPAIQCMPHFDWIEEDQPADPNVRDLSVKLKFLKPTLAGPLGFIGPNGSHASFNGSHFGVMRCV
jgi:hypothetical protein